MPNERPEKKREETFHTGDLICKEGDPSNAIFRLQSGGVGTFLHEAEDPGDADPDRTPGNAKEDSAVCNFGIAAGEFRREGALVGLAGIFGPRRTASLRAMEKDTRVERIPLSRNGIGQLISNDPRTGLNLCESLAHTIVTHSRQATIATSMVPSIHRAYDSLALAYFRLSQKASSLNPGGLEPETLKTIQQHPLHAAGKQIDLRRRRIRETLTSALAQRYAALINLPMGEVLQYESAVGAALSIILKGILEIIVEGRTVSSLGEGDFAGEVQVFLRNAPASGVLIKARKNVQMACLQWQNFRLLGQDQPNLLIDLARIFSRRLETIYRMIRNPRRGVEREIKALAGDKQSCAESLGEFAWMLPEDNPGAPAIKRVAMQLADHARKYHDGLEASSIMILDVCAGIVDNHPLQA